QSKQLFQARPNQTNGTREASDRDLDRDDPQILGIFVIKIEEAWHLTHNALGIGSVDEAVENHGVLFNRISRFMVNTPIERRLVEVNHKCLHAAILATI
ncbi:MAG: hypothetical protein ACE5KM_24905, partial [Planctomycetaceae bacterium]